MRYFLGFVLMFALAISPVRAETLERTYQAVMHVVSAPTLAVLDDPSHIVGIPSFRGLAIFADGSVVAHRYAGWFEIQDGAGAFHGSALWVFSDGELRGSYEGRIEPRLDDGIEVSATFTGFSGSGRYSNVTGTGEFAGRRLGPVTDGAETYLEGKLSLRLEP